MMLDGTWMDCLRCAAAGIHVSDHLHQHPGQAAALHALSQARLGDVRGRQTLSGQQNLSRSHQIRYNFTTVPYACIIVCEHLTRWKHQSTICRQSMILRYPRHTLASSVRWKSTFWPDTQGFPCIPTLVTSASVILWKDSSPIARQMRAFSV